MKPRTLKVLRRGGVTAALPSGDWGVWRSRDRRRRRMGTLSASEVDLLRAYNCLTSANDDDREVLRWHQSQLDLPIPFKNLPAQQTCADSAPAFLDTLILAHKSARERRAFAQAVCRFRCDAAKPSAPRQWNEDACHRLARLVSDLSGFECRFLYDLVIALAPKTHFVTVYGLRPAAVRTIALNGLRSLVQLYV